MPRMDFRGIRRVPGLNRRLTDLEHPGSALGACALCCGLAVLHRNRLRGLHFALGAALQAIRFHVILLAI